MKTGPRILIVSASIGTGHNQAAAAIAHELRCLCPQAQIEIVDFLQYGSLYRGCLLRETYLRMLHLFPEVFDFLFRRTAGGRQVKNLFAYSSKKRITDLCRQFKPQMMVFTHPLPCAAACFLKRQGILDLPVAAVVTDFGVHPFWIFQEVDLYFVAHNDFRPQLVEKGIQSERVLAHGIPISRKYAAERGYSESTPGKVPKAAPIILVMGGGLGFGILDRILLSLEEFASRLQVLVAVGSNKGLLSGLRGIVRTSRHEIRVLGFTEKVDQLMEAADLLITKPGGLTASEALAKRLPMLLVSEIAGHEEGNGRFLMQQGAAVYTRDIGGIPRYLQHLLLEQPEALDAMRTAAAALAKPGAAADIARELLAMHGRRAVRRMPMGKRKD